jgi:accessory colonization factor AcfC
MLMFPSEVGKRGESGFIAISSETEILLLDAVSYNVFARLLTENCCPSYRPGSLSVNAYNTRLASTFKDGMFNPYSIGVWDLNTSQLVVKIDGAGRNLADLVDMNEEGTKVIAIDRAGYYALVFDSTTGEKVWETRGTRMGIIMSAYTAVFGADSYECRGYLSGVRVQKCLDKALVIRVHWNRDNNACIFVTESAVKSFDILTGFVKWSTPMNSTVRASCVGPSGTLFVASNGGIIECVDVATDAVKVVVTVSAGIKAMSFNHASSSLIVQVGAHICSVGVQSADVITICEKLQELNASICCSCPSVVLI